MTDKKGSDSQTIWDETGWQKKVLSLTPCLSCDENAWQKKRLYHSHAVGHRIRCDKTVWQKEKGLSLALTCC